MLEATLQAYGRLRENERADLGLPVLTPCRVGRSDPIHCDSAEKVVSLISGLGPMRGWVTCQSAPPALVEGNWSPVSGGGAVLQADLAQDRHRSLQLRHVGGRSWRAIWITQRPLDAADDGTDTLPCLAQELTFMVQGHPDARLVYHRYWRIDAEGQAHAPLARLVDVRRRGPT